MTEATLTDVIQAFSADRANLDQAIAERQDSWQNQVTGAGTSRDKATATTFTPSCRISDYQLAAMGSSEPMARRIIDVYPREAMREGFELGGLGESEKAITDYLDPFELVDSCTRAWIMARWFGGSVQWFLTDDVEDMTDQATPLGSYARVTGIEVLDRRWVTPHDRDPMGRAINYQLTPPGWRKPAGVVHASRFVIWPGALTEALAKISHLQSWDYSVLQIAYEALRDDGAFWTNVGSLVNEASVGIFKVAGLFNLVAAGQKNATLDRYGVINRVKSLYRAIVLDKDKEEYERIDNTFAGISDLSDKSIQRIAAAAEMPVTVLRGEAPAGLNATGDSDLRWFLSRIKAERTHVAEPRIRHVIRMLLGATESPTRGGAAKDLKLVWPELWQPTAKEKAEIYAANMTADAAGITAQIFTPEEVFVARAGRDGWSTEIQFSEEAKELRHEAMALPNETDEPTDPTDPNAPSKDSGKPGAGLEIAPADMGKIVTVNEARARLGLGPIPDGDLTISAYDAKQKPPPAAPVAGPGGAPRPPKAGRTGSTRPSRETSTANGRPPEPARG